MLLHRSILSRIGASGKPGAVHFLIFTGRTLGVGVDREPDALAVGHYAAVVRLLARLKPPEPAEPIKLSAEARPYWQRVEHLAYAMQHLPTTPAALKGHLAKVPGLFARLLLTCHAVECASRAGTAIDEFGQPAPFTSLDREVSEATVKRAYDLMVRFFLPHAVRQYGELFRAVDAEGERVRRIARYILAHGKEKITDRDIYRGCREMEGEEHAPARRRAMKTLIDCRWIEPIDEVAWKVNPAVFERFAREQEAERKRRAEARERIAEAVEVLGKVYGEEQSGQNCPIVP